MEITYALGARRIDRDIQLFTVLYLGRFIQQLMERPLSYIADPVMKKTRAHGAVGLHHR